MKINRVLLFLFVVASLQAGEKVSDSLLEVVRDNRSIVVKCKGKAFVKKFTLPHGIRSAVKVAVSSAKWGKGSCLQVEQQNGWLTRFTLYKNRPFVYIDTKVVNKSQQDFVTNRWDGGNFEVDFGVDIKRLNLVGTGFTVPLQKEYGSYAYMAIAEPSTRNGVVMGWLSHDRGVGTFHSKVQHDKLKCFPRLAFGNYLVKAGKSRDTDTFVIGFFEDARIGLEKWADAVVTQENIKLKEKPGVYCTWYHRNITGSGASNAKVLAENVAFSKKHLNSYGLGVMQIDDHWQAAAPKGSPHAGKKFRKIGPIKCFAEVNHNFPDGMAKTAKNIADQGMVPGIWFMPFAGNHFNPWFDNEIFAKNEDGTPFADYRWSGTCIDSTNPKGAAFIRQRVKRIYDWGYRYFKIDGLHTGMPSTNIYINNQYKHEDVFGKGKLYNPNKTYVECFRDGLGFLHEEAPDVFVLGCSSTQNLCSFGPAFGQVDAMRVGPDNDGALRGQWAGVTLGAKYCSNVYFLNGRVWHNDPDPYYVRKSNPIEKVRWMASWLAVSGSMNSTSEQYSTIAPERLDIIKRSLPVHRYPVRPVDFLETNQQKIWLVKTGRTNLVGLFNWSDRDSVTITRDLTDMGLDSTKKYAAFEYWAGKFLGIISGEIKRELPKCGAEVISLREVKNYPQLLSTSRNINQGLTDVVSEAWNPDTATLRGKSLVVNGDSYEMRFTLPKGYKIKAAFFDGKRIENIKYEEFGVRVVGQPEKTGTVLWKIQF